jgi:hypothetical protein
MRRIMTDADMALFYISRDSCGKAPRRRGNDMIGFAENTQHRAIDLGVF